MVQLQTKPQSSNLQPQQPTNVEWESLPPDFILPDEPVESILQPLLAAALTEALDLAGLITATILIASNMALTAKIDDKTVVKAPDWFFVAQVLPVGKGVIRRSYTPHLEGEIPSMVMEFLSESDGGEYSLRPYPPYGKMWFYERIVQVPVYIIFEPSSGLLEVRRLNSEGLYEIESEDENGRYFLDGLGLYLGVWQGTRLEQNTYWLRWWDREGNLLLWGSEKIAQEKQRAEQEKQRAEQEKQRAEQEKQRAEQEKLHAEEEKQRANSAESEIAKLKAFLQKSGLEYPDS
jgi:hypothetical protein